MFSCLLMASPRLTEFVKKQSLYPSSLLCLSQSIYDRVSSMLASALRLSTSFSLPDRKARRGEAGEAYSGRFGPRPSPQFVKLIYTNFRLPEEITIVGNLDLTALTVYTPSVICIWLSLIFLHALSHQWHATCLRSRCDVYRDYC